MPISSPIRRGINWRSATYGSAKTFPGWESGKKTVAANRHPGMECALREEWSSASPRFPNRDVRWSIVATCSMCQPTVGSQPGPVKQLSTGSTANIPGLSLRPSPHRILWQSPAKTEPLSSLCRGSGMGSIYVEALRSYCAGNFPKYRLMWPLYSPLATAGWPIGPLDFGPTNLLPTAGMACRKETPACGKGA